VVTTVVTRAAPHHLIADGAPLAVRPTRSGDAWQAAQAAPAGPEGTAAEPGNVLLGMPALRSTGRKDTPLLPIGRKDTPRQPIGRKDTPRQPGAAPVG
jgi:hypothetical protein